MPLFVKSKLYPVDIWRYI